MRRLLAASGLVVSGFVGAALLAGCGGGGTNAEPPATSAAPATTAGTALAPYDDCLSQHGVDPSSLPTGGFGNGIPNGSAPTGDFANGSRPNASRTGTRPPTDSLPGGAAAANGSRIPRGTLDATQQAARDACQSLLPQGTGGAGARGGVNADALRLYLSCLSDNGVPVSTQPPAADPPSSLGAGGFGGPGGLGGLGGIDRSSPAFAAANAKCQVLLPTDAQVPTTSR